MLDFLKGYKIKLLGLVWVGLSVVDGLGGIDLLKSVDATNWLDNVMFGIGVFAGRDTLDSLVDRIKRELA